MSSTSLLNNFYSQKLYEEHTHFTVINPINLNYTEYAVSLPKWSFIIVNVPISYLREGVLGTKVKLLKSLLYFSYGSKYEHITDRNKIQSFNFYIFI